MSNLKLYMIDSDHKDEDYSYQLLVWAPTARFAVIIWREWAMKVAQAFGYEEDQAHGILDDGPNEVFLVPHVPPENIPGAGSYISWGAAVGEEPSVSRIENIPPEEWR